jgi:hypothetical protein
VSVAELPVQIVTGEEMVAEGTGLTITFVLAESEQLLFETITE